MSEITGTANTITVSGHGTVQAAPDFFHINIGIEAQRATVREAYAAAGTAMNAVQVQLLTRNVARDAISSTALDVRVESRWQDGVGSIVTGYTVSSNLNVMLRYDEDAQNTIAAVVDTGTDSVRLNGLTPAISDPAAAQDAARALAWANARSAADLYAQLAGVSVGPVVSISEGPANTPGPAPIMARAMMATEASMAIEPGQSGVSAAVTVTWTLV